MIIENKLLTTFPSNSKVWIYQSQRVFTAEEITLIKSRLNTFLNSWASHGSKLNGTGDIFYNRFIVLVVDERTESSGCSIDQSINFIKELENILHTELLSRSEIAFRANEEIKTIPFQKIQEEIKTGNILPTTIIYNNTVSTLSDFMNTWEVEAKKSWLSRYFNN